MTRGPKRVVSVLLTAIILSTGYLDYWAYSQAFYKDPTIWMDVVGGTANAPSQYRIGVVDSAYFLARHLHAAMRHTLAILDVISGLIAVFALFLVLQRSAVYRRAGVMAQWFGAASFIVLVQFYLAWLLWYQRPETLPTAAALALTLLLVSGSPGREGGGGIGTAGTVLGLLLLAVAQGFVRADVAFALHLGILFICLTKSWRGLALPRGVQAGTSMVAMALAVGIQYWLMKKVYPQASYGDTPVLQLFLNLKSPQAYAPFLLFMLPAGWTGVMLSRRRYEVESADMGVFAAAVIFLGMWVVVGKIGEVRIFMPFALALVPLTVELAMQRFLPDAKLLPGERSGESTAARTEATLPHS